MADQRGQRDHAPEPWTDDPDDWPSGRAGDGEPPRHDGRHQVFGPPAGWAAPPGYTGSGRPGTGRAGRGFITAAVVLVAALVTAIVAVVAIDATGHQNTANPAGNAPPAQGGNGGAGAIVGGGGGTGGGTLFMGGQVTKVSSTSITISGQNHQITAAITNSTKLSGVSSARQIKDGDEITAQITGYGSGHVVATAIQDPASMP